MYTIGPYRFTETDATRTVRFADEIFDLYAEGRDAGTIEQIGRASCRERVCYAV